MSVHAHRHGSGHGHHHHHGDHDRGTAGSAFAIGIGLNLLFVVAEAVWGIRAGSMALLADAGHNLSDVLALGMAWGATFLARRKASARFTYGLKGSSIMAALFNAVLLLFAMAVIAVEAVERLGSPHAVDETVVILVAAAGIVVNGVSAWLFASGRKSDLNVRAAFAHMTADAAVAAGVVAAGLLMIATGWLWIDAAAGLAIVLLVVLGTWPLLRDAASMAVAGVPSTIDGAAVGRFLASRPGVSRVHDLHIWPMSTSEVALTVHLVMPGGFPGDAFVSGIAKGLRDQFHIPHTTIQIETGEDHGCAVSPHQMC